MRTITATVALLLPLIIPPLGAIQGAEVSIAVPGRSNQTHSAAALGDFVVVAFGAQLPQGKPDVFVVVSRDGGKQFSAPVQVNGAGDGEPRLGGELPPRVGLVERPGANPEIVVAYGAKAQATGIRVARSVDGGRSFAPSRAVQEPGVPGDRGWHAMTVDRRGTAHVMWLDHRGLSAPAGATPAHTHGQAESRAAERDAIDGVAMAQRSGLYYAREGADAARERELLRGVCYCCKVAMASTPQGGILAAWRHVYPGNIRDIAFIASRDGGQRFDAPTRVSVDDWQLAGCPDDGPSLAVDGEGTAHIVWPTVVNGPEPEGAIFYASSADGRTFTPRVRVPTLGSPRPMHPQVLTRRAGLVTVAWDEVIGGVRQAAIRNIRFDEAGQPIFGTTTRLGEPSTPGSYPFLVSTSNGALAIYVFGKAGESVLRVARF
jgi:hypothetical protein